MIPKIIHYCWVGNAPKPKSVLYCIESWKKFCPDYEIREWNESNYDFSKNLYMKQAYDAKKWGFVPDYARLDIVYEYGGIYLDTDVELIKGFDEMLNQTAFMGFENTGDDEYFVNCGHGFGAEPHHEIIGAARDLYNHIQFINEDSTYNMLPSPHYTTQALKKYGLVQENRDQKLSDMMVYASDVLCPKSFRTGEIHKTVRTVSIHHFTASWMDEQIKGELRRQQRLEKCLGKKGAQKFLWFESIWKKYAGVQMFTKLPKRLVSKTKTKLINLCESVPSYKELIIAKGTAIGKEKPVLLDPAFDGDNVGDQIIMENCLLQLPSEFTNDNVIHVPTHRDLTNREQEDLLSAKLKILCGTNALSGHMRSYGLWRMNSHIRIYKNTVLMGVGFDSNNKTFDFYTKLLFMTILSSKYLHSVRDTFSEAMLRSIGIKNVVYTGCPTMWKITPELCSRIPRNKADYAVCTLTDYNRDIQMDQTMLDILSEEYKRVFLWPQGIEDNEYFQKVRLKNNIEIVPFGLEAYDKILDLKNVDYIGTRLHAGIRALGKGHRTIVISIDNRARNIGKDTGLPVIEREDIEVLLRQRINSEFVTDIKLPIDNIRRWKNNLK